jgi:hypothetical protein
MPRRLDRLVNKKGGDAKSVTWSSYKGDVGDLGRALTDASYTKGRPRCKKFLVSNLSCSFTYSHLHCDFLPSCFLTFRDTHCERPAQEQLFVQPGHVIVPPLLDIRAPRLLDVHKRILLQPTRYHPEDILANMRRNLPPGPPPSKLPVGQSLRR